MPQPRRKTQTRLPREPHLALTPPAQAAGIAGEDWQLLFDAVLARLRQRAAQDASGAVLECVQALEQLRAALPHDLGPRS
jgi:hypothetical protein